MDIPQELAKLIRSSDSLRGLLDQAATLVAERMDADVCSIYLLDPADRRLWLVASHGFRQEAVGEVSLSLEEGLTGEVVSHLRQLAVVDAPGDPRFRNFPEADEEGFRSYLGEPLAIGRRPVGAIVLRTRVPREFSAGARDTLSAIASQLVGLVENARLVKALGRKGEPGQAYWQELEEWYGPAPGAAATERPCETLHGNATSPGIALGDAIVLGQAVPGDPDPRGPVDPGLEREKLKLALARLHAELEVIRDFTRKETGEDTALIFGTHLLFLSDEGLMGRLETAIAGGVTADRAAKSVFTEIADQLGRVKDAYLRQRSDDIRELRERLLEALSGSERLAAPVENRIVVIPLLTASAVVECKARGAVGIVAAHGAPTSHGAILSRSFQLPVVAGVTDVHLRIATGDRLALDGTEGSVIVRPGPEVERSVRAAIADEDQARRQRESLADLESVTLDGRRISLLANVGLGADLRLAAKNGAEGVGLYRTEISFLVRETRPSRAEQAVLYRQAFAALPGRTVTFRTLDLGGDKFLRAEESREKNPFLGYRSIRLSLGHPEEFVTQIQAFQIASLGQDGRIMLPLVSRVSEVRQAREHVRTASRMLAEEGIEHHENMPLGVMIEVPAAVEIAAKLAREVSFFSIGTNDLAQYTLAVDRGNERVAHLGDPYHPAVLSMIFRTVQAAREAGIGVSVCGEMGGNPASALLLIGLGVDQLSMSPTAILAVKETIRAVRYDALRDHALAVLEREGPEDVRAEWDALVRRWLAR